MLIVRKNENGVRGDIVEICYEDCKHFYCCRNAKSLYSDTEHVHRPMNSALEGGETGFQGGGRYPRGRGVYHDS